MNPCARLNRVCEIMSVFVVLKWVRRIDQAQSTTGYSDLQALCLAAWKGWGDGSIVEIGAYKGKSAIALAAGSRMGRKEKVISIDPHSDGTLPVMEDNLRRSGLHDMVVVRKTTSADARKDFDGQIRLLFIDGLHDYPSVKQDIGLWKDLVIDGGLIAFHDYNYPTVRRAVEELTSDPQFILEGETGCSVFVSKGAARNRQVMMSIALFNRLKRAVVR